MSVAKFEVRWVYQQVTRHGQHIEAGQKPALCFRGRKHALCIAAGYPVRILKRPVADYDRYRLVMNIPAFSGAVGKGQEPPGQPPYPVQVAVATLQRLAESHGITTGAAKLLERAATETNGVNEDEFEDEEEIAVETKETEVTETNTTPATPAKEKTVSKKAPKVKVSKAKTPKGPTPFRLGTAKEQAFVAFKAFAGKYEKLEKGEKGAWIEKQAKALKVTAGTLRSWIGGDFRKALK